MKTVKKILLVPGWDYRNYTSKGCNDSWANRRIFVDALSRTFQVATINLPGFCGMPDPKRPWTLDDYAQHVGALISSERPDVVLGYSFGAAVLLRWKVDSRSAIRTVLVSPAIVRAPSNRSVSLPPSMRDLLPRSVRQAMASIYLRLFAANPYYTTATPVMKQTYRNIVGLDLRSSLRDVHDELLLVYGSEDTATPPFLVQQWMLEFGLRHQLRIISNGGHDIATTNTEELVTIITDLVGR